MLVDRFGRTIDYLRISVTDRCDLRCIYCIPDNDTITKHQHREMMSFEEIINVVEAFVKRGLKKVRLTGGEPFVRKGLVDLIRKLSEIEGLEKIALTTNGQQIGKHLEALKSYGVTGINFSLDTLDAEKYKYITNGGEIENVLSAIEKSLELGFDAVKINTVLIDGFNTDEVETLAALTLDRKIDVRFIELMPIGAARRFNEDKYISTEIVKDKLNLSDDIYIKGSPATYFRLSGAKGKIGLINPISCNFCSDCNRMRLTSDGKLKPCLHTDEEIDILQSIRLGEDVDRIIDKAIFNKPEKHDMESSDFVPVLRSMFEIGG